MFSIGTITLTRRSAIRISSLLLTLLFLLILTISPIAAAKSFAATLTVVGSVALTMATIASIYMICAGASGMDGAVRNQARATGTQPLDYMGQLLNRWLSATGVLPATLATKFQQGFSYLPDGTLFLDNECTEAVADFQRWAWDVDGGNLISFGPTRSGPYLSYAGMDVVTLDCSLGVGGLTYAAYISDIYSHVSGNITYFDAFRVQTFAYAGYYTVGGQAYKAIFIPDDYSGTRAGYIGLRSSGSVYSYDVTTRVTRGAWWITGTNLNNVEVGYPVSHFDTDPSLPDISDFVSASVPIGNPDTFYGPAQQDQGTQIAAGSAVTVSPDAAANLHIANYLRAMAAAYAGTGVADVPVTDTGTGEDETLPLSVPLDTPLTVTGISDSAIDQSGSTAVSDSVATDFTGLDDYTMDLTRFFPFCIPFDLAALFQKFEAEAAAPVVDIPFPNPADPEGTPLSVHVDLTPFDDLASVVRKLELVAFVIGLCFLTKRLIQGGD